MGKSGFCLSKGAVAFRDSEQLSQLLDDRVVCVQLSPIRAFLGHSGLNRPGQSIAIDQNASLLLTDGLR